MYTMYTYIHICIHTHTQICCSVLQCYSVLLCIRINFKAKLLAFRTLKEPPPPICGLAAAMFVSKLSGNSGLTIW